MSKELDALQKDLDKMLMQFKFLADILSRPEAKKDQVPQNDNAQGDTKQAKG